jgi:hypothetical protein
MSKLTNSIVYLKLPLKWLQTYRLRDNLISTVLGAVLDEHENERDKPKRKQRKKNNWIFYLWNLNTLMP